MGFIPLAGQAQGGRHAGDAAADDKRGLADGEFGFGQRLLSGDLVDGHAYQVLGFLRAMSGLFLWTQESWLRMLTISNRYLFSPALIRVS
jgi:hypothetical protein